MNRREFSKSGLMLGMGSMAGSASGGPAGVLAATAAARQGAKTVLTEMKGYPGGTVTEGGTTLHSFFNIWKPFPGVKNRQVVRGIPNEIMDRLDKIGGWAGFGDMKFGHRDSVNTVVDTELYKLVTFEMLVEAGVYVCVKTAGSFACKANGR